ncbi:MAG: hypothetical protein K2H20_03375 [Bacilli bacterium]|nr:hypothetical protein [Bacilli bacterium]
MKKENVQSKKNKIITGAARATACVALTGLIVGSLGVRLASLECGANHSVDSMCPMAKIEMALLGVEAGMSHQADDIARYNRVYSDHSEYTQNVTYMPAGSYMVPEGYMLKTDEDGQVYGYKELEVLTSTYINEFGQEQNVYSLPEGGVLGQNSDGSMYGYKTVEASQLENDTIYYTVVTENGVEIVNQYEVWTYNGDDYSQVSEDTQVLRKTR